MPPVEPEREEREKVSKVEDLWIDIGAVSRTEAAARIRIGDPGVLAAGVLEFPNGRLVSRSIDNRIGAFVVLEALRVLSDDPPAASVTAVATTREEIAATGGGARSSANRLEPDVAIVIDVTHATDYPGIEKRKHGDFRLGGGPVLSREHRSVSRLRLLVETAEASRSLQHRGSSRDTILTRGDLHATAAWQRRWSRCQRYMHSPTRWWHWKTRPHCTAPGRVTEAEPRDQLRSR